MTCKSTYEIPKKNLGNSSCWLRNELWRYLQKFLEFFVNLGSPCDLSADCCGV